MAKKHGLSTDKGQYVKSVGYNISKLGNVSARRFYLGDVAAGPEAALTKAAQILSAWRDGVGVIEIDHKGERVRVWGSDPTALPLKPLAAASIDAALTAPASPTALTVGEAATAYLDGIKRRMDAKQVTHAFYSSEMFRLQRGIDLLGRNKPLAAIGTREVEAAVLALAARPMGKPNKGQKSPAKPLSVKSVKSYLSSLKWFLDELSKTETAPGTNTPLWNKPLRFDDFFRNNQPQLTAAERDTLLASDDAEADAFTVDELATLYKNADYRHRLWISLSLNCGFANMELNTLTVSQCVGLDADAGDAAKIRRFRGKTNIYAEWSIWRETADLLRMFIEKDRKKDTDSAIVTEGGDTLIEPRGNGRRDAVRSAWENLIVALPKSRRLSFKYLRKSGAKLIRDACGDDVAQMYLSQADSKGVLKHYASRDWSKLSTALIDLRRQLAPMFAADVDHDFYMRLFAARNDKEAIARIFDERKASQAQPN